MSDQVENAANLMARDYLILAFLVSLGSLQITVSISGIRGLWLLPSRLPTRILGIVLIILGIALYILSPLWVEGPWAAGSVTDGTSADRLWGTAALDEISAARNLNDIHGGMAGTAYAGFFVLSAVLATLFAATIGTVNNRLFPSPSRSEGDAWSEAITQGAPESSNACSSSESSSRPFERGSQNPGVSPAKRGECPKDKGGSYDSIESKPRGPDGLDALKNNDPLTTFKSSLRNLRLTGANDIRNHLQSAHRWSIPSVVERMWSN